MGKISLWGVVAIAIYLALVGFLFMSVADCQGEFCGAGIVVAMLPWVILFEDGLHTSLFELDGMAWFWTVVTLNVVLLYFLFSTLQRWFQNRR